MSQRVLALSERVNTSTFSGSQAPEDLVELGRISDAYGIKGWIRIRPHSSDGDTLLDTRQWWLKPPAPQSGAGVSASARLVKVANSRVHADVIVARLDGMLDRNQAEALKGWTVWVSRADFPALQTDEYYWVDLVGCRLYGDDDGESVLIGEVAGVMDNGAHGILRVNCGRLAADGQVEFIFDAKGRPLEALVPFVAAHVHTVDLENKQLFSNWPIDA